MRNAATSAALRQTCTTKWQGAQRGGTTERQWPGSLGCDPAWGAPAKTCTRSIAWPSTLHGRGRRCGLRPLSTNERIGAPYGRTHAIWRINGGEAEEAPEEANPVVCVSIDMSIDTGGGGPCRSTCRSTRWGGGGSCRSTRGLIHGWDKQRVSLSKASTANTDFLSYQRINNFSINAQTSHRAQGSDTGCADDGCSLA